MKCIQAMETEAVRTGRASVSDMPEECWKLLEERLEL